MRGRSGGELIELERGLANAKELHDLISQLQSQPPARLFQSARYYTQWTGFHMSIAGIYFLALKEKVGHGNFKKYLGEKQFRYMFAWECMKAAHVVSRHELFGKLRSSRAFRQLISLPEPHQGALANELRDIPADRLDDLMPDLIQKRYDEIREAEMSGRRKKRDPERLAKINAQIKAESADEKWMEFCRQWGECRSAMGRFSKYLDDVEIEADWYDRIFGQELLEQLGGVYGKIASRMHPIEEIQKRAEIIEAPGYH